jgi:hypothetical protein
MCPKTGPNAAQPRPLGAVVSIRIFAALADYHAVLTGCHPEYYSRQMLDALSAYLGCGGRLTYMGGNGFYWRVSYPASHPGMIELRRAEDGTRAWVEATGEYYHSSTGEYGGLWRRQGRAPNALAGVGFVAQGFDRSSYYRRTTASRHPRACFIFEGVDDEILGDFGLSGGGAAGLELDAFNPGLGSPPWALVVASSDERVVRGRGRVVLAGGPRRHGLLRAPGRRRRLLHRLHLLRGQPLAPQLTTSPG